MIGVGNDVQLYDVDTFKESMAWDGHRASVNSLSFSKDSQRLYSSTSQSNILSQEMLTWNAATWQQLHMASHQAPKWPNIGAISPEQTYYVGKDGDDRFSLFDLASGKMVGRFNMPKKQEPRMDSFFSPAGKFYVISVSDNAGRGVTRLFAIPSCKLVCQLPAVGLNNDFRNFGGRLIAEQSLPMTFSGDDRLVAMVGQDDGLIHVFDTATGKLRHRLGTKKQNIDEDFEGLTNLAFSPDGKLLASWNLLDSVVRVWDMAKGKEWRRVSLEPDDRFDKRVQLAWSPDGRMLAVGDRNIQLWEVATLKVRREFSGHEGEIRPWLSRPTGAGWPREDADTTALIWDVWGR